MDVAMTADAADCELVQARERHLARVRVAREDQRHAVPPQTVRLLGDVLGRVMVEQHGPELLDAEERIRLLSRQAREGAARDRLSEAVRCLVSSPAVLLQALHHDPVEITLHLL